MEPRDIRNFSVSHGTMQPRDLIPDFLDELRTLDPAAYNQMHSGPFPPVPAYVWDEGDDSDWWDGDDAIFLLEDLFEALNNCAPDGYYFGAHPGDDSDYGFWECEGD